MSTYYPPTGVGEPDNSAHTIIAWVVAVCTLLYMLPWAIAATRHTKDAPLIGVVNLLLGWSVIGWIVCLIWAMTNPHKNAHLQAPMMAVALAPMQALPMAPYQQPASHQQYQQPAPQQQYQPMPQQNQGDQLR